MFPLPGNNYGLTQGSKAFNMVLNSMPHIVRSAMSISLAEDIRSVTDLKRHTREILDHIHQTGRPVVLTVNGRADSVIIDAKVYEKQLKAMNLARLLSEAETQVTSGETRPARAFLDEFKNARNI